MFLRMDGEYGAWADYRGWHEKKLFDIFKFSASQRIFIPNKSVICLTKFKVGTV